MERPYNLVYSEAAADCLLGLKRSRLEPLLYDLRMLADDPFVCPDYTVRDVAGHDVEHLLISGFVVAFHLDHAVSELRILDISDVS